MEEPTEQQSNDPQSTEPQAQTELQSTPQPSSPSLAERQNQESHTQKAAAVDLRTRLGPLWHQPRARWLGLLAIIFTFGLSAVIWYVKYFAGYLDIPEYYIVAPIIPLILLVLLIAARLQPRAKWLGLLAIVIALGLSGFLFYLRYFEYGSLLPEYYIVAPIIPLILLVLLIAARLQPRAKWLGLLAIIFTFGLSAVIWYVKYIANGYFDIPEYYIIAPIFVLILLGFLTIGYTSRWSRWTGLGEYDPPHRDHQRSKTLWDWLQLLIIPVLLAAGVLWFNYHQDQLSHQTAADQQQETTLQTYFDKMSDLLLMYKLHESKQGDEARQVARARTLTTLRQLNPERKGILLRFLYEADLINAKHVVVALDGADLNDIDLSGTNLSGIDLSDAYVCGAELFGSNLSGADLSGADLVSIDLGEANLSGANLKGADLSNDNLCNNLSAPGYNDSANLYKSNLTGADLTGARITQETLIGTILNGATMPDGSKHP